MLLRLRVGNDLVELLLVLVEFSVLYILLLDNLWTTLKVAVKGILFKFNHREPFLNRVNNVRLGCDSDMSLSSTGHVLTTLTQSPSHVVKG